MTSPDCDGAPDWAFQQLLRAEANASGNVCLLLTVDDPLSATMRLQTNLYHLTDCKGGAKKCGVKLEAIEINYDQATISCVADVTTDDTTQCTEWQVVSNSDGILTHGSGGDPVPGNYAVDITFCRGLNGLNCPQPL